VNHLLRELAPVTETGWGLLDEEARDRLTAALGARRLVDFSGPLGWDYSATNLGRTRAVDGTLSPGLRGRQRRVLPLVEVRAAFSVGREELRDADRGALDIDLGELDQAARRLALTENTAVFHGWPDAGIVGVAEASSHEAIPLGAEPDRYPRHVAKAVEFLLRAGISGPYGIALGPDEYTAVVETTEHGGYPLFDHLRKILDGPLVWAPGVDGGVVVSLRGGDYLFECGQDIAIGYDSHGAENVELYFVESFSFRVATPEAAVALPTAAAKASRRRR
jgi:uncharacterized linocin/CFP29 family protein